MVREECIDPLKLHQTKITKYLRKVTPTLSDKFKGRIPIGEKICCNCISKLQESQDKHVDDVLTCEDDNSDNDNHSVNSDVLEMEMHSDSRAELGGQNDPDLEAHKLSEVLPILDMTPVRTSKCQLRLCEVH